MRERLSDISGQKNVSLTIIGRAPTFPAVAASLHVRRNAMNATRLSALLLLMAALLALGSSPAAAQTCRWDGTAPLCSGECSGDETEMTRLDAVPAGWVSPFINQNPPFGANCATGTKALCCKTPGRACRWDGTAPFCEGSCRSGETAGEPPAGSSSGSACWTGSKQYCCRQTGPSGPTSVVRSSLESAASAVIYTIPASRDLLWYRHLGHADGTFRWAFNEGKKVGNQWAVKHVFAGDDGVIYAVNNSNDLLWYRHVGQQDGTFTWAFNEGKKVGNGWRARHMFYGGDGIIYVVKENGDLLWYRHDGRNDGTFRWAANAGRKVGHQWNVKHVFYGGDGIIYVINNDNELLWYRHEGRSDGSFRWAFNEGKKVGHGWDVKHVFSSGDGIIYAINQQNDLMWYQHLGREDGSFQWTFGEGKKVGNGWDVRQIFSGARMTR